MGVVSSVASPSGVASQICTETRQSLNGLTAHSPSGCLASTLPGRCSFLLARGPLSGWYGFLRLYRNDFLDGNNAFSCCQGKNSATKALLSGCWPHSWPRGEKAPLRCWCSLSLPPWQARNGLPQGNRTCVFFTGLQVKARVPQARRAGSQLFVGGPTRGFVRGKVHVVLLTFSCRRKTVSNLLVASLRSSSVVAKS